MVQAVSLCETVDLQRLLLLLLLLNERMCAGRSCADAGSGSRELLASSVWLLTENRVLFPVTVAVLRIHADP